MADVDVDELPDPNRDPQACRWTVAHASLAQPHRPDACVAPSIESELNVLAESGWRIHTIVGTGRLCSNCGHEHARIICWRPK